jgi:hypothetical protein
MSQRARARSCSPQIGGINAREGSVCVLVVGKLRRSEILWVRNTICRLALASSFLLGMPHSKAAALGIAVAKGARDEGRERTRNLTRCITCILYALLALLRSRASARGPAVALCALCPQHKASHQPPLNTPSQSNPAWRSTTCLGTAVMAPGTTTRCGRCWLRKGRARG